MPVWFINPGELEPMPVPHAVNSKDAVIANVAAKILGVFSIVALLRHEDLWHGFVTTGDGFWFGKVALKRSTG
jgi:hypothetical protein